MQRYLVHRLLAAIPVILLVGIITFSLLHIAPGDPASVMAGPMASPELVEKIRHRLGTDKPFLIQFGFWTGRMARGDLGTSVFSGRSITELMRNRIEPSLSLAIQVILFSSLLGISAGVLAAWRSGTLVDRAVMLFAVLGFSVPGFWVAVLLIWGLAVKVDLFPVLGYTPVSQGLLKHLHSMFLPVLVNSILGAALIARMTRSAMLEVLGEDYIRTARAKGLSETVVYIRHALRNASIPIVTVVGLAIAAFFTGAVVTETVFAIPGLGRLTVDAITRRDYPIIQAMLMFAAVSYVTVNLVIDLIYVYLDPRIRYT